MQLQKIERIGFEILQTALNKCGEVFAIVSLGNVWTKAATGFCRDVDLLALLAFELR
jgi:hypothetical protein